MNSKERVLTAVNMTAPDRTPADFHGNEIILERLYRHFGIHSYKQLVEKLDVDMIDIRGIVDPIWTGPVPKRKMLADGVIQNYLGFLTKKVATAHGELEEHCGLIFGDAEDAEDIDEFSWPSVDWFDFSNMNPLLDEYRDYAIIASGASVYQHPTLVRGIDNFLCDLAINPCLAEYLMDKYVKFYLDYFEKMFMETEGRIDILRIADDLGMQDRLLISPQMFRRFFKPRIKQLVDMAHSYNVKVMFHSCGSIIDFIDDIIDAGVDILDPIQTRAKGMMPEYLKTRFGERICFHGSIDTQYTLPQGTAEEIEQEVKDRIEVLGKNGGFIIAPSHTVQPDVPVENVITMYESIKKYR